MHMTLQSTQPPPPQRTCATFNLDTLDYTLSRKNFDPADTRTSPPDRPSQ
jgi:hypothetical protein